MREANENQRKVQLHFKMSNLKQTAAHLYRQYELITCINMFEPWERKLISKCWHLIPDNKNILKYSIFRWICPDNGCAFDLLELRLLAQLYGNSAGGNKAHKWIESVDRENLCSTKDKQLLRDARRICYDFIYSTNYEQINNIVQLEDI